MKVFQPPMTQRALRDVVAEYEAKSEGLETALATFKQAATDLESASNIGGEYGGQIWGRGGNPNPWESTCRAVLLKAAWKHVYKGMHINKLATAKERKQFEVSLENPPELTLDNISATFGDYVLEPRFAMLKGLAEVFSDLDPAYKSHSKVKIGVEGLPKRIILSSVGSWGSWGYERLRDLLNALNTYEGRPHVTHAELEEFLNDADENGAGYYHGIELRRFNNGNGHLIFSPDALRDINKALAEFYGDVLPDGRERNAPKQPGTAVAKDLQFYPTPPAVADSLVSGLGSIDGYMILEPSCGQGALLEAIRRKAAQDRANVRAMGIEYNPEHAQTTRDKGFSVLTANFLDCAPKPDFDLVIMNPPFFGKHYQKHIEHARRFLKPGGMVRAIMPVTAFTDHGFVSDRWQWHDLPIASFRTSGTNINTGWADFGPAN